MNKIHRSLFAAIVVALIPITPGCALFSKTSTTEQKAADVQNLSQAAASVGTQVALQEHPEWRPQFELAYTNLDQLVTSKTVTGTLLRGILASLPIKQLKSPNAQIAIEAATVLY